MEYNVNFKGRLVTDGITANKARWKNIAKIFKEETKGINYESRVFNNGNTLEIFVDRIRQKNKAYNYVDEFESREAILTLEGTKELLSQSDNIVAKTLAEHLKFVQKLDNNCKLANKTIDKAFNNIYNIFTKNGFNTEYVDKMFEEIYASELGSTKVVHEYKNLRNLPGFKDAEISHVVDYVM